MDVGRPGRAGMAGKSNTEIRYRAPARVGASFVSVMVWLFLAAMLVSGPAFLIGGNLVPAFILIALAAFFAPLAWIVHRDARMKWRWRIAVDGERAEFHLPATRSSSRQPEAVTETIPLSDMARLICLPEVYSQMGASARVHSYWLELRDGRRILLGEDRQVSNAHQAMSDNMSRAAKVLSSAAGIEVDTLDEQEGSAGFLGLWGVEPPDWPAD